MDTVLFSKLVLFMIIRRFSNASFVFTSSPDKATAGVNFTFTCTTDVSYVDFRIGKTTQCIIIGVNSDGTCKLGSSCNEQYTYDCEVNGVYKLTIPSSFDIDTLHDSVWKCGDAVNADESQPITLYVYVPITQVTIKTLPTDKNPIEIISGTNQIFNCETDAGRPSSRIQWYISGTHMTEFATTVDSITSGNKSISSSTLTYTGNIADKGKIIYCNAVNIQGISVISQNKSIVIWYPPQLPSLNQTPLGFVNETDSIVFTCEIREGNPLASIIWQCAESSPVTPTENPPTDKVVSSVQIIATRDLNGKLCTCIGTHPTWSEPKSSSKALQIKYAPTFLPSIMQTPPGIVLEGTKVKLTCEISEGYPSPSVSWKCNDFTTVDNNSTPSNSRVVSSIQRNITRTDDGKECVCTGRHLLWTNDKKVSHKLDVSYPPYDRPSIQQIPPGGILHGKEIKLTCTVTGGNPLAILTWDCDGTISNETTGNIASYSVTFVANRTSNNKICTCSASHVVLSYKPSISHQLIVYYEPIYYPIINQTPPGHIISGTNVILTCEILGGNPLAILSWNCTGVSRNNTSANKASYSVEIVVNRTFNNIICACSATHYIPSFRPTVRHMLDVYFKPFLDNTIPYSPSNISATENKKLKITLAINANPKPAIQWTFTADTGCNFNPVVSNTTTNEFLTSSFILIDKVRSSDFGEYTFTANNTVGMFFRRFEVIKEASKQEMCAHTEESTGIFVVGIVTLVVGLLSLSASVIFIVRNSFRNKTMKSSKSDEYTGVQKENPAFVDEYTTIQSEIEPRQPQEQSYNTYEECEGKTEANPYSNVNTIGSELIHTRNVGETLKHMLMIIWTNKVRYSDPREAGSIWQFISSDLWLCKSRYLSFLDMKYNINFAKGNLVGYLLISSPIPVKM